MITAERFRSETEPFLTAVRNSTVGFLAVWIEDDAGQISASSGPEHLVAVYTSSKRSKESPRVGLVDPPRRLTDTYGVLFGADVTSYAGQVLGTVMLLTDFGQIVGSLMDPRGLGETGEMLVGVANGQTIRLILPPRLEAKITELSSSELPPLSAAATGKFGYECTVDYRDQDVLVAYRPVGTKYPGWGLIAKIDSSEAYAPVRRLRLLLLALGGVALALGLCASNAIARRFAQPIRRLARTSAAIAAGDLSVRSEVRSSDEIGALGTAFNRMTEELARSYANLERRISERTRDLEAVRDLLDAFFRISTSRQDPDSIEKTFDSVLRFCSRLGYDLAMISLVDREAGLIRACPRSRQHDRIG